MPEKYYLNKLYPVQDKILRILEELPMQFYLTGGTALSRAWLHHRFSDDLDFFVNDNSEFKKQTESVLNALKNNKIDFEIATTAKDFLRIFIINLQVQLKIDFVNDVKFRYKTPQKTKLFKYTDHPLNILVNKICALQRLEIKDVIDIVFISRHYAFNWEKIITVAQKKDIWVEPVQVAGLLDTFPVEQINQLKMATKLSEKSLLKERRQIVQDIINGSDNSLHLKY